MKNTTPSLLIALFSGILLFPWINGIFGFVEDMENTENRLMAEVPEFDLQRLDPFPHDFEKYLNDHFNLRNLLIRTYNSINYEVFDVTGLHSTVVKGKEDYFFLKENLLVWCRNEPYLSGNGLVKELTRRSRWCRERNMEFLIVLIPRKYSIYPEKLPWRYIKRSPSSNLEQLVDKLEKQDEVTYLDLTPFLLKAKEKGQVFHQLDMHWTDYGAFVAYQAIMEKLQEKLEFDTPVLTPGDFKEEVKFNEKMDMLKAFQLLRPPLEEQHFLVRKEPSSINRGEESNYEVIAGFGYQEEFEIVTINPAVKKPRAFIIRDSFSRNLIPLLSEHFSRATYIWDSWRYELHPEKLEKEKPDLVITIMQENALEVLLY